MTKGNIITMLPNSAGKIDSAIPLDWAMNAKELGIDTTWYAWDYREDSAHGKPINLLEEYCKMLQEANDSLSCRIIDLIEKKQS